MTPLNPMNIRTPMPARITALLLLLFGWGSSRAGQDLYDLEHTLRFSDYLMRSRQYALAAQELERASFLAPGNDTIRLELLKAYRLGGDYQAGIRTIERTYLGRLEGMPAPFGKEYTRDLVLSGDFGRADFFLQGNRGMSLPDRNDFRLSLFLVQRKWEDARGFAAGNPDLNMRLVSLADESADLRYKHGGLALAMSAVIPGSGKFYTRRWKDGLISFVFVVANAYQAYRGFNKNGVESVHGWVFGGLALGFYTGNLYGSYRSARIYNRQLDDALQQKAMDIFRSEL